MEKEKDQENMFRLNMIEQQMNALNQQLEVIEREVVDLKVLEISLDDLNDAKGRDILASIGKGIFTKAKVDSENLIVDIGNKTLVKKSVSETQKLIKDQVKKLDETKKEISGNLNSIANEAQEILKNVR